jgi:hypothetical protein
LPKTTDCDAVLRSQTSAHIDTEEPNLVKVGFVQFVQDAIVA